MGTQAGELTWARMIFQNLREPLKGKLILEPAIRTSMSRWTRTPTASRAGGPDEDHEIAPPSKDGGSAVTDPAGSLEGVRAAVVAAQLHLRRRSGWIPAP